MNKGSTLIEVLIALVVLSLAITPALYTSTLAVNASNNIKDNMIAAGLAQEGVEVIRAIRDKNWLANDPGVLFDQGLIGTWRVEWNSNPPSIPLLAIGTNPLLKINNGLYNYTAGTDTIFRRKITITKVNADEMKIVCEVSWKERNRDKIIQVESHLFNWK